MQRNRASKKGTISWAAAFIPAKIITNDDSETSSCKAVLSERGFTVIIPGLMLFKNLNSLCPLSQAITGDNLSIIIPGIFSKNERILS